VPETVRRALRLRKRDKIHYDIRPSGEVVLTRASDAEADDPVLGQFLGFLAHDIATHPERLQSVSSSFVQRVQSLVGEVISGAEGARKVRWQRQETGKRGGARVIYFHLVGDEVVLLVMVYAKAERSNVKPKDIKRS
jgi:antitoxin PrlF